jgi:hypothetical protein
MVTDNMCSIPTVGSVIRVTTRHPNYYYLTAKSQPWTEITHEGTVVPGGKWDNPNTFCMTGDVHIAIRNIALHSVIQLEILKGSSRKVASTGIRAFRVKSAKNSYTVTLNATRFSCTCVGFQYHRNCRHTKAVAKKLASV